MDNDLSSRLDNLERRVNFWRTLVVLLVILCAASMVSQLRAAPARIDAKAVFAQEFNLVNSAGRVTARFAPQPDEPDFPYLVLKYPNNQPAVSIGVESESASTIIALNNNGHPRALMSEHEDGPAVSLFDEGDKLRVAMVAKGAATQIAIYDKNTKRIWVVPTN
jgi:hypothetical protein